MNNEIQEILDKLKDNKWYNILDLTDDKWIDLKQIETNQILDYITSLEQEIARLKERSYINLERNIEAYKIVEDYESRIDKAVKYIKKHILKYDVDGSIGDFDEFDILIRPSDLLDMLQNGGDKDE